jgi:uncharacterized membrane protein YcjF (UPF0283 family)
MEVFMAKKKAEDMRDQLRQIISFSRGPSAWDELVRMEARIRKERQELVYRQQERQRQVFEYTVIAVMLIVAALFVWWMVDWLYEAWKRKNGY